MATSNVRLINGVNDRYLSIAGEGFVRPHGLDPSWKEMVIGLQCSFNDSGASAAGTTMGIGICAGVDGAWNASSPTHWFGASEGHDGAGVWTRYTSPNRYATGYTWRATKWENGVKTVYGSVYGPAYVNNIVPAGTWYRGILAVRIRRVGTAYYGYIMSCSSAGKDYSLLDVWENADWGSYPNHTLSSGAQVNEYGVNTLTVDEATYGALTHINVFWNKSTPALEIYGLTVKRLA